uniref:Uncharacterized protein n=1 Tax=Arundo donax TaxID=35708 RepID=A0A0A9BI69_ARUDO
MSSQKNKKFLMILPHQNRKSTCLGLGITFPFSVKKVLTT